MKSFLHMSYIFLGFHFLMLKAGELYEYINGSPIIDSFWSFALVMGLMAFPMLGFFIVVEYTSNPKYHK